MEGGMILSHRTDPNRAYRLFDPKRKKLITPNKALELLELEEFENVADLGAGNGYFTLSLTKKSKMVYAVDIEPRMLKLLMERAEKENISNIRYVESNLEDIKLEKNIVDR
ncbi:MULTISPECIES: class I SAM-dependent methyltransferase [Bacillaceae]|nr:MULTISPECIES: class I SAM-dependent methyltransferase [Bacillaceae]MDU1846006.1 class I SAM-dependent methyltransferase [Niallia nealsonii]HEO8421635.1 class I SAM-dependent methyltransferase [Yersinia enterocolitica]MDE5055181.1 class I SAM-dependent methyltransferase [Niallia taxi]MED3794505.1 class I SAM-dependent methyltransferase [Niallia alba]UYG98028.1 class I SAM-dependent methyltransferase [Cytobacillus firmus]